MTANEFEWVRKQRCGCCLHKQKTTGHDVVYCDILFQTVKKGWCCAYFFYAAATLVWLKHNFPLKQQ